MNHRFRIWLVLSSVSTFTIIESNFFNDDLLPLSLYPYYTLLLVLQITQPSKTSRLSVLCRSFCERLYYSRQGRGVYLTLVITKGDLFIEMDPFTTKVLQAVKILSFNTSGSSSWTSQIMSCV